MNIVLFIYGIISIVYFWIMPEDIPDPVEAMIDFWGAYMYSIPGEGKG